MFSVRPFHYAVVIFAAALTATTISMHVGVRADRVSAISKQIKSDTMRIQLLNTELAYLASPQRIQALVGSHRPDLNTPKTEQYLMSVSALLPVAPQEAITSTTLISAHETVQAATTRRENFEPTIKHAKFHQDIVLNETTSEPLLVKIADAHMPLTSPGLHLSDGALAAMQDR